MKAKNKMKIWNPLENIKQQQKNLTEFLTQKKKSEEKIERENN